MPDQYRPEPLIRGDIAIRATAVEDTLPLLQAVMAASDYGFLLTALDHTTIACNRRFGEIFQLSISDAVRAEVEELREMVFPLIADKETWLSNLEVIYDDPRATQEDELELLTQPATMIRRFAGPVFDAAGVVIGRLWTFLDITREVRLRRMQASLSQVALLFSSNPGDVYWSIVQSTSLLYNGAAAILYVLDSEKLVAKESSEWPMPSPLMEHGARQAIHLNQTVLIQNEQGHRFAGAPFHDSHGRPIGVLSFCDDRTNEILDSEDERFLSLLAMRASAEIAREKHLEQQRLVMKIQREQLRSTQEVLKAMNEGYEVLNSFPNLEAAVKHHLRLLQNLLGYRSAAILLSDDGKDWHGQFLAQHLESASTVFMQSASDPIFHSPQGQLQIREAEGSHLAELLGADVLGYELQSIPSGRRLLVALGRQSLPDLSDRHQHTHLKAIIDQTMSLVATYDLRDRLSATNQELRTTQEQLVQSEKLRIVGTLAGTTAHDIRNILSSLSMELSFHSDLPAHTLAAVRSQLDRFTVLSHRLLSYARPRLLEHELIDIDALISRVLSLTSSQLAITHIDVSFEPTHDLAQVMGDPSQVEHLLVNLVLNAVQAMHTGGGKLTIGTRNDHDSVQIEISDTGIGISDKDMNRLFEPFQSTRQEGFGLGLYSCKRIVHDHGGRIEVRSKPGEGSTFTISLPAHLRSFDYGE